MIKMADSLQGPTFIDWVVQGHTISKLSLPHTLPAPQNLHSYQNMRISAAGICERV